MPEMAPTFHLRWLVESPPVVTAAQITAERRDDETLMQCKQRLVGPRKEPVLQQLWQGPNGEEEWRVIPVFLKPARQGG